MKNQIVSKMTLVRFCIHATLTSTLVFVSSCEESTKSTENTEERSTSRAGRASRASARTSNPSAEYAPRTYGSAPSLEKAREIIERLIQTKEGRELSAELKQLAVSYANENAETFFSFMNELPAGAVSREAWKAALSSYIESNPRAVIDSYETFSDNLIDNWEIHYAIASSMSQLGTKDQASLTLRDVLANEAIPNKHKNFFVSALLFKWSQSDLEGATVAIDSLPPEIDRMELLLNHIPRFSELAVNQPELIVNTVKNSKNSREQGALIQKFTGAHATKKPKENFSKYRETFKDENRKIFENSFFSSWASWDPSGAVDGLDMIHDQPTRDRLVVGIVNTIAVYDPKVAEQMIESIVDPKLRATANRNILMTDSN